MAAPAVHDRSALHKAAASGSLQTARQLLAEGADPSVADGAGVTPLHDAAAAGHADLVQLLLQAGAVVAAARAEDGVTPLHLAAGHGHTQVLQHLLESGATDAILESWEGEQCSALQAAAIGCHTEAVEILTAAASADEMAGEYGFWALASAAESGDAGITALLLAAGAPMELYGAHCSWHALLYAAGAGNFPTTRALLDASASLSSVGRWCPPSLDISIDGQGLASSAAADDVTALHAAAAAGACYVVWLLLHEGASVQAVDCYQRTALHYAAAFAPEHLQSVLQQLLLASGVAVNAVDGFDHTALQYAAFRGSLEGVQLLLAQGADVEGAGSDDDTCLRPFHAAVFSGKPEVVQALLAAGADTCAVFINWSPLQLAALLLRTKVVDCLLQHVKPPAGQVHVLLPAAAHEGRAALQRVLIEHLQQGSVASDPAAVAMLAVLCDAWQEAAASAVDMLALRNGVQSLMISMAAAAKQQNEELAKQRLMLGKQRRKINWQRLCCCAVGVLLGLTAAGFRHRRLKVE